MKITEKQFWDNFWGDIKLPVKVDYKFKNDRVIANLIKKFIPINHESETMIEIGCAPGKWLVFFNKELNYKVIGLEYLESAAQKTRDNLVLSEVSNFEIINADFFDYKKPEQYNVVCSLGFVEHFTDWESVLDKHIEMCQRLGYIVIGFPCFKGINYYLQKILDKYIDQPLIPSHNLKIMDLKTVKKYVDECNVDLLFLNYIGGFEPALFDVRVGNKFLSLFFKIIIKGLSIIFGNFNSKYTSSYIMLVIKKK